MWLTIITVLSALTIVVAVESILEFNLTFDADAQRRRTERHADHCAPDQPFCENVPNYPSAYIERQLNAHPERFAELFGTEQVVLDDRMAGGDADNSRGLCSSRETIIYPKKGLTAANTWMYIVNFKNYVQGIRVEMCDQVVGSTCDWPARYWPIGMRPVCRQKYIFRQLLAIDGGGRTVVEYFRMPCCCNCVLMETRDF